MSNLLDIGNCLFVVGICQFARGAYEGPAGLGRLACGDPAATFGDGAGGQFPLQAAPNAASDTVAPRFASVARGWAWRVGWRYSALAAARARLDAVELGLQGRD